MPFKVGFVTYRENPRMTEGDALVRQPLSKFGGRLLAGAWDNPSVRWADFDVVVLRSTWNYHLKLPDFRLWLQRLENDGINLWNPPQLVRWNADKRYLLDLQAEGVHIPPTVLVEQGSTANLPKLLAEQGWAEAVIKLTVSATAHQMHVVQQGQAEAQQYRLDNLLKNHSVIVQPLLGQIRTEGEWSFIFFRYWDGTVVYSHVVRKFPARGDLRVQSDFGGRSILAETPPHLLQQAEAVVDKIEGGWLYARVDGIVDGDTFLLMELELIEPELFLDLDKDAPRKFAATIGSQMG